MNLCRVRIVCIGTFIGVLLFSVYYYIIHLLVEHCMNLCRVIQAEQARPRGGEVPADPPQGRCTRMFPFTGDFPLYKRFPCTRDFLFFGFPFLRYVHFVDIDLCGGTEFESRSVCFRSGRSLCKRG